MSAPSPDTWSIVTAVTGIVTALGGLVAAGAAYYSAKAAKDATGRAEDLERRGLLRDVLVAANSIVAETLRIDDLAVRLKREYLTLSAFSGSGGGSRVSAHIDAVEKKQTECGPAQTEARAVLEQPEQLRAATEHVLADTLIRLEGILIQVRRVKEKFLTDLQAVEQDNLLYREKAIRGPGAR